jgi:hypothetical protein
VIDPDHPPRWWTVEEANEARSRVSDAVDRAKGAVVETSGNGHRTANTFEAVVAELEEDGIVLRDLAAGLIDFPARAPSGRGYWLCWLVDEPEVAWWHWPEDGFAGRRPLSEPPQ